MSLHLFFTSTKSGCLWKCPTLLLTFPAWSLVSDTITYTGDNLTSDLLHSLKSVDNHSIADRAGVTPHSPSSFWDRRLKEERNWKKKQQGEKHESHETVSCSNRWHGILAFYKLDRRHVVDLQSFDHVNHLEALEICVLNVIQ